MSDTFEQFVRSETNSLSCSIRNAGAVHDTGPGLCNLKTATTTSLDELADLFCMTGTINGPHQNIIL